MSSPAHDIALHLAANGIGIFGADLFVGEEPTSPDACVTVYDYAGDGQDTDELDDQPRFQVRVRNPSYADAYAQQESIKALITQPLTGIESATSLYPLIALAIDIASIGRDGNRRHILVASYRARRTNKET